MPKKTFFNLPSNKRENIIQTAYDIFIENDYHNINIRSIASRMEISIGSFYQYFHDKDDLYIYLISDIEKRIYDREVKEKGFFLIDKDVTPIEEIFTKKEIDFNRTWYKAPVEVMMKFYFGEYSKELNSHIMTELINLKKSGKLKDFIDIDFVFYIYSTTMFNVQMYFRDHNIVDEKERLQIKRYFYQKWLLDGILNPELNYSIT